MKHTTIKYDPILGAQTVTVELPETQTSLKQELIDSKAHKNTVQQQCLNNNNYKEAQKAVVRTRAVIVNKQRVSNGRHK